MSIARRMVSGNLAGLASIGINLGGQVLLVPLFLLHWSTAQYGVWLGLLTAVGVIQLIDNSHLDYVGFACMKLPSADRAGRSQIFWDALPALALSAAAELILLTALLFSPLMPALFSLPADAPDVATIRMALAGLAITNYFFLFPVQLIGRVLASMGHYPATAWWYAATQSAQLLFPALAVMLGAGLGGAAIAMAAGTIVMQTICLLSYLRLARAEGLTRRRPQVSAGLSRLGSGLMLGVSNLLENLQQTGFRLILLPFLGPIKLVQFSTMRTVANVVQQGMLMLTNPSVPELMRFVSDRDTARARMVMTAIIYVAVVVMCPGFVLLQAIVRPLFDAWTLGKVAFEPLSFVALSASVLFTGLGQSARAITRGNNLIGVQIGAAFVSGTILMGLTFLLAPRVGLFGVALSLAMTEAIRSGLHMLAAGNWSRRHDFAFPRAPMLAAIACTTLTVAAMAAIALLPRYEFRLALAYVPPWIGMNLLFWRVIGEDERSNIRRLAGSLGRRAGFGRRAPAE